MAEGGNFPPTALSYLKDSGHLAGEATVLGVVAPAEGGGPASLVLDATLFYPEGGGQPSDIGEIRLKLKPENAFRVAHVKADKAGVVRRPLLLIAGLSDTFTAQQHPPDRRCCVDQMGQRIEWRALSCSRCWRGINWVIILIFTIIILS